MMKLGAMARYELLMAWRRGSLPILALLLTISMVGFGLLFKQTRHPLGDLDPVQSTVHLSELMFGEMIILGVSVPLLLGDVIPLDRQFKVRELLDVLPISRVVYLGGKLLSVWLGLILSVLFSGVISGVLLYAIFEGYDLRAFAALWSTLLPLGLTVTTITVLANTSAGSRRISVMVGMLIMMPIMILVVMSLMTLGRVGALIDPTYAYRLNIRGMIQPSASADEIASSIVGMLALDVLIVVVMWTFTWARQRALSAS